MHKCCQVIGGVVGRCDGLLPLTMDMERNGAGCIIVLIAHEKSVCFELKVHGGLGTKILLSFMSYRTCNPYKKFVSMTGGLPAKRPYKTPMPGEIQFKI